MHLPEMTVILFVKEPFMDVLEDIPEVARDAFSEVLRVLNLEEILVREEMLFEQSWHLLLDVLTDPVPIDSVTITDTEQMEALVAAHVWGQHVRVLVNLVRIARLVSARGGEGELCDRVEPLAISCGDLALLRLFAILRA